MSHLIRIPGPPLTPEDESLARAWEIGDAWRDGLTSTLALLRSADRRRLVMPRVDGEAWACSCTSPGSPSCDHVQALRLALRYIDRERLDQTGLEKRIARAVYCTETLRRFEGGADGRCVSSGAPVYVRVTATTWECTCPQGRGPRPCLHARALHRTLEVEAAH